MARFTTLAAWLEWQEQCHPRPIDLGLERVAAVYRALAVEVNSSKIPTITVAGTNGKGSCVAYLEAIYRAQGYRVGTYTSPHIVHYNERIRIDGLAVDDDAICDSFTRIDQLRHETSLSYFEFGTLAALDLFRRAQVDIQILEVGLGGRLDAVNIVDPDVALVTTVAIDHVEWLGNTLDEIGREKAGIFRSHIPAVVGDYQPPKGLLEAAKDKQATLLRLGSEFDFECGDSGWYWRSAQQSWTDLPRPALKGDHQYRNASAVLMAVHCMQETIPVSEQAIKQGLQSAQLAGRFQWIDGTPPVLMDVGHNPQAVATLRAHLIDHYPNVTIHALFNMMKDKDIESVLKLMRDRVSHWYISPLKTPRAIEEAKLLNYFQQQHITQVSAGFNDFAAALSTAKQQMADGDLLLIFGSFFLVSEFLANSHRGV